jgi:transglutaminase-like putative cysteine protease
MRYCIRHSTHYTYSQPVFLQHHVLRLSPRSDGTQTLHQLEVKVEPEPQLQSPVTDLDGNATIGLWFANAPTTHLRIETRAEVATHCTNPFGYFTPGWASQLPIDYPSSLAASLRPYLDSQALPLTANVVEFAQGLLHEVENRIGDFLLALTQRIYGDCTYMTRHEGAPFPAGLTWQTKQGSCRDFVVLFMAACRAVGLAARFVSGYQEGDPDQDAHDLHAWAEVYIPGGGWRGFDPTHGLAVSDRHVAIAAAPHPSQAAPVTGALREGSLGQATLTSQIHIHSVSESATFPAKLTNPGSLINGEKYQSG